MIKSGTERRNSIMTAMKSMVLPASAPDICNFMDDMSSSSIRQHLHVLVVEGRVKEIKDGRIRLFNIIDRSKVGRRKGSKSGETGSDMLGVLSDKAMSMKDISNSLGLTVRGVHYHLQKLIDDGDVGSIHNGRVNLYYKVYNK